MRVNDLTDNHASMATLLTLQKLNHKAQTEHNSFTDTAAAVYMQAARG